MTELAERTAAPTTQAAQDFPTFQNVRLEREGKTVTLTMTRGHRRNSMSEDAMQDIIDALDWIAGTDARVVVLAGEGPVFSSGHDFGDLVGRDLHGMRALLKLCTDMMLKMHAVPQVIIARVHGLATAGGCQLVAGCDLAVAAESAQFRIPGGKGGWFCHTPSVGVSRNIGRKRVVEMALTGEPIDAKTAEAWGLINYAVPDEELDDKIAWLAKRASDGAFAAQWYGKEALYNHLERPERDAYMYAIETMAASSQVDTAQEAMQAFVDKKPKPTYE